MTKPSFILVHVKVSGHNNEAHCGKGRERRTASCTGSAEIAAVRAAAKFYSVMHSRIEVALLVRHSLPANPWDTYRAKIRAPRKPLDAPVKKYPRKMRLSAQTPLQAAARKLKVQGLMP